MAIGIAIAVSAMTAPDITGRDSGLQSALDQGTPALPQTEIPEEPSEDSAPSFDPNDNFGFESDDNPIIIEDQSEADSPASNLGPGQTSADVEYELHVERSENAFWLLIPAGWTATSGVGLSADSTIYTFFLATSPDEQSTIGFQRPRAFSYLQPVGVYTQEGQIAFAGSMQVYYYRTADNYVTDILIPEMQGIYPDIQLVGQAIMPSEQGFSAGFFEFVYSNNGTPHTMQAVVTTYGTPISGQIPMWDADWLAVTAPTDRFDRAYAELAWNALGTMIANPVFVQNYIQAAGKSSAFLSQSYNESFFSSLRAIQQSQNSLDAGFQGMSDATLGVHQVRDPNGNTYTVPNSHNDWYVGLNSGHFYGSNTGKPGASEELISLQ